MIRVTCRTLLAFALLAGIAAAQQPAPTERPLPTKAVGVSEATWQASGAGGAVVAGGSEAVDAGIAMLKEGGNAVDAAVATILAQTVTDANQFCFGGEVPILVYDAGRGVVEVVAGMGEAPRLATRDHFAKKDGGIPARGLEAAAVPATLDSCLTALDRFGTRRFAEAAAPALRILDRREQPWHADLARTLRRLIEAERASPDRRRGLRLVADYFYRGPLAREIDAWSREHGGLIRFADLAAHVTRVEEPATAEYRGYTVCKCGPWTQGPALLEALQLIEGFDLKAIGPGRPAGVHLAVEALKLAFADRDTYYADPLFADVPLAQLLAPSYAESRRRLIDPQRASLEQQPGDPRAGRPLLDRAEQRRGSGGPVHDTTTCLVADRSGNVVAATPSGWSGVLAGSTGVWLGSRLQSFNTWEGHPNVIEPGKRPRITLSPTLVLKAGRPAVAVSVAGGDGQDQVTLQMLLDLIDFGLTPAESVTAPRFATEHFVSSFRQVPPKLGSLTINAAAGDDIVADLSARGHRVKVVTTPIWVPTVLRLDPATGRIEAAGDPKTKRHAAAF
jgi:gamma-glutamyltranspeptidase / glutathione hydrolase